MSGVALPPDCDYNDSDDIELTTRQLAAAAKILRIRQARLVRGETVEDLDGPKEKD